jgi:hypothetical protein
MKNKIIHTVKAIDVISCTKLLSKYKAFYFKKTVTIYA